MALHGGTPHESTRPSYEPCPYCKRKGFWRYTVGANPSPRRSGKQVAMWRVTRCRYCGHYRQEAVELERPALVAEAPGKPRR